MRIKSTTYLKPRPKNNSTCKINPPKILQEIENPEYFNVWAFFLKQKKCFRSHMGNHFIQFNIAPSEKNMVLKAARLFRKLRADTYGDLLPTMIIATAQTLGLRKLGWNF